MKPGRRQVVLGALATGAAALSGVRMAEPLLFPTSTPGRLAGAGARIGHMLRDDKPFNSPSSERTVDVVIAGGGIAGLSAAWKLQKSGATDFIVLDLEDAVGGNARAGKNAVSAFPWGAHYVPVQSQESKAMLELFSDLGVITGYNDHGVPIYNELFLCGDPEERLLIKGRWQEGLVPSFGISSEDEAQIENFTRRMESLRYAVGDDGRPAFTIPLDQSSTDEVWRKLDHVSMKEYMLEQGWTSRYLHWYVNYCCRDDYGTPSDQVSAWAGLHYFAARRGWAANASPGTVVTWPEGNSWLAQGMAQRFQDRLRNQALVRRVAQSEDGVVIDFQDTVTGDVERLRSRSAILCVPRFVTARIVPNEVIDKDLAAFSYAPWMVAATTLDALPGGNGMALCWDNVAFDSESLGYVVATHQRTEGVPRQTVLSLYWPLSATEPKKARGKALETTLAAWQECVAAELERMHPGISAHIKSIDVWVWGHGMIRPTPGFIWGEERQRALQQSGPIFCAHSDLSGISIFEEAQYQGVRAAERAMAWIRHPYQSSL